jgi:hypothetical protein
MATWLIFGSTVTKESMELDDWNVVRRERVKQTQTVYEMLVTS